MRNAFIEELVQAALSNDKIVLVVGDLGYGVVEPFAEQFPKRFFNAGVAEQNMMGLAAGLASEGYHVFVYSIANFPTFRCAEQIRNDIDYHQLPVTVVSVGGGLAYGNLGYSHHAVQDYALIRSFPNMLIAAPGDPMEVRAVMRYILANPQPSYLRLGKAGEINMHNKVPNVEPGEWVRVREGNSVLRGQSGSVLLTTGAALHLAFEVIKDSPEFSIYTLPLWGMRYKSQQSKNFGKWTSVTTYEDHLFDGGFGSWILEAIHSDGVNCAALTIRALDSRVCGMVGSQKALHEQGGLIITKRVGPLN
ncbi:transketolase [Polynucleobacter paneuropaeus]|nr:transketolase [Polynucleobacter paneuropaeus]